MHKLGPRVLNTEQAQEVFSQLDETGHVNPKVAKAEKKRFLQTGVGVEIDPLSGEDPSGSNVSVLIRRTAVTFVLGVLALILISQITYGFIRRINATQLMSSVSVESVAGALRGGVEWGDGFTQFPALFSVQEANEATGRIEVTVVDTTSNNEIEAMAASYIQATAFATNALLNDSIKTVVYRVQVHEAKEGRIEQDKLFGFLQPAGPTKNFMTFIFTKGEAENGGFNIFCTITGLDEQTTERLRERIGSTPLINFGKSSDQDSQDEATTQDNQTEEAAAQAS